MKLTQKILVPRYIGGQMAISRKIPGGMLCTNRGEIKKISIEGSGSNILRIKFAWWASCSTLSWNIIDYGTERRINLSTWVAMGPVEHIRGGECIFIEADVLGETAILLSRENRGLDPRLVQGFDYALAYDGDESLQ